MISIDFRRCCAMRSRSYTAKAGSTHRIRNNSRRLVTICLALAALLAGAPATGGLPAFPGAEGAGALAMGGRGGAVCKVTNLNDAGPGSFRDCVLRKGPRTVIFEVGGTIKLKSRIWITNPYLTIAGQTAPGGGIQIKADKEFGWRPDIVIGTHDVVIRYLRLRRGYVNSKEDNISISDNGDKIILDHLSIFWAENQNIATRNAVIGNITFSNNIITEMTDGRVAALINSSQTWAVSDIDFHNNLWANSKHRQPRIRTMRGRFINNILYNWDSWSTRGEGAIQWDWISNLWKPGPHPKGSNGDPELQFGLVAEANTDGVTIERAGGPPSHFVYGNRGILSGMSPDTDNWPYTREFEQGNQNGPVVGPTPIEWRRDKALLPAGVPITVRHVDTLEDYLLPIVGASRRLDCDGKWVPNRDEADQRVITEYLNNQGTLTKGGQGEEVYGGHPTLASGVACQDTSGDGVPDAWAIANGFNPLDPTLGKTIHETGYTYLELYLNGIPVAFAGPSRVEDIRVQ